MTIIEAAQYIHWAGNGDNILSADRDKLAAAIEVVSNAPSLLTIEGPRGPGRIVAVDGSRVAFSYDAPVKNAGWGCFMMPAEIGGFTTQGVAQYLLRPGSPSKWIRGCYSGGAFALTPEDAERIGFTGSGRSALPKSAAEMVAFGSNVSYA